MRVENANMGLNRALVTHLVYKMPKKKSAEHLYIVTKAYLQRSDREVINETPCYSCIG